MTSGQFHSVEISTITVDRAGRQRRELTRIPELAESIGRLGLIHPITLTRAGSLIAGERRFEAVKALGWTHISAQYVDELDGPALRAIELEENIKRVDISWQDQSRAILEYHELRKTENPDWKREDTAEAVGLEESMVRKSMMVAQELRAGNARVIEAQKISTAIGIVERNESRKRSAEVERAKAVMGNVPGTDPAPIPKSIIAASFQTWVETYNGPRFNFIHCDFPYGIDADKFNQSSAPSHGDYSDTEDTYFDLLNCLLGSLDRLATESCHIMFWFSMRHYNRTLDIFDRSTFSVDVFPLVWMKSDGSGILPDPSRGPRRVYETALFGARGDRKIVTPVANAYSAPLTRGLHMSEKNQEMLSHFFRMFVDEHTIMLDPTCGSGSALRAAESLGAKQVLGLEINPEFAALANEALEKDRIARRKK